MSQRSKRSRVHLVVALLAVLAMLAAACGDDSADSGAESTDSTPETETTDPPTTDPVAPPATDDVVEPEPTDPPIELTDSFRGVTADTIKLGVPWVDTTAIGWSPSHDAGDIWQVAADTINADGGVLGRNLELVTVPIDPTDSAGQDATCVRLTEDEEVFAVLGVLLREAPLCYTAQNDTAAINTYQTDQGIYDQSTAPLIGFGALPERAATTQIDTLLDSGYLDGRKVALSGTPSTADLADTIQGLLEAGGIEVVSSTQFLSDNSDQLGIDSEMDVNVEVWKSAGADAVLAIPGAAVPTTGALSRNAWDGLYVVTDATGTDLGLLDGVGYSPDALVGSIGIVPPTEADLYEADEAGVKECVDTFDAASDDPVVIRPDDSKTDVMGVIVRSCQALELFRAVAEAAGPDLTNDSFAAAADSMGDFTVTGILSGSLTAGKRDFVDAGSALFEFDEDLQLFVIA